MAVYEFPGDILNVSKAGRHNGNDRIAFIYEFEREHGDWPEELIPFYGIGNGDYFALDRREGRNSAVYYRYHEDGHVERYSPDFAAWVRDLPDWLDDEDQPSTDADRTT